MNAMSINVEGTFSPEKFSLPQSKPKFTLAIVNETPHAHMAVEGYCTTYSTRVRSICPIFLERSLRRQAH